MFYNKKNILRCLHLNRRFPLPRQWKAIENTIEGIFSDIAPFYIDKHLNTFSNYFIIIQYAYK